MAKTDPQDELTTLDHVLVDVHEILKRLDRMEGALLKYEPLAAAALNFQQTARMRLLGKGGGRRASKNSTTEPTAAE